jgi:CelD/BcsL family acetyltransferase involved in cellulose biosynthesis
VPRLPASPSQLSVRLVDAGSVASIAPVWQHLEDRFGGGALTCSWDWTRTWLEHYGDVVPHHVGVIERSGVPRAAVLVTEDARYRRGPFRVRRVRLGTVGEPRADTIYSEYNRILADPSERAACARALLTALRRDLRWQELRLDAFAPEDAEPFLVNEARFKSRTVLCRIVDLDAAREVGGDVVASLPSETRYKIRRSRRGFGSLTAEWGETPDQALDIFEELTALHQARWTHAGMRGAFASPRAIAFHRTLIPRLVPGRARLLRLRQHSRTVGCLYVLVDRGRALSYQSGLAKFADNRLKPGMTVEAEGMQRCLEDGLHEYDFLGLDTRYKREMTNGVRHVVWAAARSSHLKWTVIDAAGALKRGWRRVAEAQ